jgi:hypothetical protein
MRVYFVLIAEGSSDRGMVRHLEALCIEAGADEASGSAPDFSRVFGVGNSLRDRFRAAIELEPSANLFFLHRDADSRDHKPRHIEIREAIEADNQQVASVAVVPVQETEAWLLLDEAAIRRVAANPNGRVPLNLPAPTAVEQRAHPKEHLQEALITASELTGRRLDRFKTLFGTQRRILLELLPIGGPLEQVNSWTRLRADIRSAIDAMK